MTLSLTSGSGALSGTASRSTDTSGVATFDDLSIDIAGAKQLTAGSSGLTSTVSDLFTIVAGAPAAIAVTGGGTQSTQTGTLFPAALQVRVTDALGNPVGGATVTFTAPVSSASAVLGGGGSVTTDAGGYVSVSATANGVPDGPYTVTAAAGTAPPAAFLLTNATAQDAAIPALGGPGTTLAGRETTSFSRRPAGRSASPAAWPVARERSDSRRGRSTAAGGLRTAASPASRCSEGEYDFLGV